MRFDEQQAYARRREFAGPISNAAMNSPIIHTIIDAYACGKIVTKEEALSQMVLLLAENCIEGWNKYIIALTNGPQTIPTGSMPR